MRTIVSILVALLLAIGIYWWLYFVPRAPTQAAATPAGERFEQAIAWQPIFVGVDYVELHTDRPRPLAIHVVRVDLEANGIELVTTPSNGDRPEETDGEFTSIFARESNTQVTVNGAPFYPSRSAPGLPKDVRGLLVTNGELVSDAYLNFAALVYDRDTRRANFQAPPFQLEGIESAVGGFSMVLRRGRVVEANADLHPRTAVGTGDGGRTLFLVAVDGRQSGYSEGVTTGELGSLLLHLGADFGLNLDGGGTSTMVIQQPNGKQKIVNQPIHNGVPGAERVAGCHLGIQAKPLEKMAAAPAAK